MLNVMTAGRAPPRPHHPHGRGHRPGPAQRRRCGHLPAEPPVIALVGDSTAMYTIQALWTMAREELNVTSIVFNNASYSVLNVELERVGAEEAGPKAQSQLDLHAPVLDFARMAQGMGVHAVRTTRPGPLSRRWNTRWRIRPHLIEAVVPESLSGAKR